MEFIFKRIVVGQVWMELEVSSLFFFFNLIFVTVGFVYSR